MTADQRQAEARTAAVTRIDAAFERYQGRPQPTGDRPDYDRQRADDASTVLCHLIGALEAIVISSEHIRLTPARVAGVVEQAVAAVAPEQQATTPTLKHALTPLYGRVSTAGLEARCGADGPTVVFAADVTCPECKALMAAHGAAPVLHWPSRGLRTTTLCQGQPLTATDFAETKANVTCSRCRARMTKNGAGR